MIAESQSFSRAESHVLPAAFIAVLLFIGAWGLLHVGFYRHKQIIDTPIYQRYGNEIARGEVPYRGFAVEYPPAALPMFALPGLAKAGSDQDVTPGFRHSFQTLMWFCGAAALFAMAGTLQAVGARRARVWAALVFAAIAPLLLGSVILSRFDLWPAALVAAALAAFVGGWLKTGSGLLGVAIAAKWYPAVLVPLVVAYAWRRDGRRVGLTCLGVAAAVVIVIFVPFVALAPHGVWESLHGQLTRPLQIETLGAALLIAAHHLWGHPVTVGTSHGSQNLVGHGAHELAIATSIVQVLALLWIWIAFARSRASREQLLAAGAAALSAFIAFGKVLSPQFMIWLIPLVPLVHGRRGLRASVLLGAALVLTGIYFPFKYWDYAKDFQPLASWLVLARDLALVGLFAVLARAVQTETRTDSQAVARPSGPHSTSTPSIRTSP